MLLIRRIRDLLYEQGFTISGARNRLSDAAVAGVARNGQDLHADAAVPVSQALDEPPTPSKPPSEANELTPSRLRAELLSLRDLLDA